jgi:hypothetical protein
MCIPFIETFTGFLKNRNPALFACLKSLIAFTIDALLAVIDQKLKRSSSRGPCILYRSSPS